METQGFTRKQYQGLKLQSKGHHLHAESRPSTWEKSSATCVCETRLRLERNISHVLPSSLLSDFISQTNQTQNNLMLFHSGTVGDTVLGYAVSDFIVRRL